LDDIPIYSNQLQEYKEQVQAVMTTLKDTCLYLKAEKYKFDEKEVK
jgi:hypothetical protein